MGRKKKAAVALPGDVSGEPDINGEVNLYNKAITDKMMIALTEELIKYENKERIKLLDLSNNKLTKLPDKLQRLHKLETLVLSCNRIEKLPHWVADLAGLKELWLQDNPITVLPRQLEQCLHLRRLTVDHPLQKEAKQVLMMCKNNREVQYFQKYGTEMPPEKSIDSEGRAIDDGDGGASGGLETGVIGKLTQVCVVQ